MKTISTESGAFRYIKIVAIALLPVFYMGVFLTSMWDPYSKTDELPIAVVNKDQGTQFNQTKVSIGNTFYDKLKDQKDLKVKKYDSVDKAKKDLKHGKVFGVMALPSNLSKQAVNNQKTTIDSYVNGGRNYTAERIVDTMMEKMTTQLNQSVSTARIKGYQQALSTIDQKANSAKTVVASGNTAALGQLEQQAKMMESQYRNQVTSGADAALIKIHKADVYPVKANGEGMAPYFIAVAIWLVSIAEIVTSKVRRARLTEKGSKETFWRLQAEHLGVSIISAGLSLLTLSWQHNLEPNYFWQTFFLIVLSALVFMTLIWFLRLIFGVGGMWLALVLMIIQIASAGGSYPVELSGGFYEAIHGWLPMSYLVDGLRSSISMGGNAGPQIWLLILWFAIFAVTVAGVYRFEGKNKRSIAIMDDM